MKTTIYRATKLELVHACQELEKRGFTCTGRITPVKKYIKHYQYHDSRIGNKRTHAGTEEHIVYRAVMECE